MKKIGLLCITALMGLSLAACGNSSSAKKSASSSSRSISKVAKKQHKQSSSSQKKSSSSSESIASGQQVQAQQATQTSQQNSSQGSSGINNADDAVNAAHSKYGDQNGYIQWGYMIDAETGQPIRNADGSYFVKGTADDGTMTGTQYSLNVYPDGSMTSN
ncbi:MAG: hypothetical protein ACFN06_05010 [Limosilactobacillus oris]